MPRSAAGAGSYDSAERLAVDAGGLSVWWAPSSVTKIQPDTPAPNRTGSRILIRSARNEREAACIVVNGGPDLTEVRLSCPDLAGPQGARLLSRQLEFFQAQFLKIERASDSKSRQGWWPDPLVPLSESGLPAAQADEPAGNRVFWLRTHVPAETRPGAYRGAVRLQAGAASVDLPLEVIVYDFALPDRMSCQTAFGFSPGEVFRYHGLTTDADKRAVLDKYLANLAAHHVSPYDPAPLDPFQVRWPKIEPPRSRLEAWSGLRLVTNEVHSGKGALLVHDDQPASAVTAQYEPLIAIPSGGLRLRFWFRTAVPGHRFIVTLTHYDAQKQWMSGRNNDMGLAGSGLWEEYTSNLTSFPEGAAFVRLHLRGTTWTDNGEGLGLVWYDDVSLADLGNGSELLAGGDFERKPRTELVAPREKVVAEFDFTNWDRAMERAMNTHRFTSFQVPFPGLGGGTFHEIEGPSLLGFHEDDPEYDLLMASYGRQLEAHLRERGWLERAFVYWFDEPSPEQYPFVMNGFAKLKRHAPGLTRMLTEQVEAGLIGGPNLWCPISNDYRQEAAEARRARGERFWWYVCTGPKAPYAGLFIDHPAPEMRVWVWQTWQRKIEGLLVWQINYWTSSAAYPDRAHPQNPYLDPMSWTSGYSTPPGEKRPWGNGDGRFLYPPLAAASADPQRPVLDGPIDSIRWEHLRDGIEDYEFFCLLRDRLARAKPRVSSAEAEEYSRLLQVPETVTRSMTEFAPDGAAIEAHRHALARAIEKLGES